MQAKIIHGSAKMNKLNFNFRYRKKETNFNFRYRKNFGGKRRCYKVMFYGIITGSPKKCGFLPKHTSSTALTFANISLA